MQSDERNHLQMTTEATLNTPLLEGKITKITGFGAFVELTDGRSGLIHISEIADGFVDDIHRFVTEGQEVKVVLVNTDEKGRLSLSLKRAAPSGNAPSWNAPSWNAGNQQKKPFRERPKRQSREAAPAPDFSTPPPDFDSLPKKTDADFEDMMSKFKARSDEKISDLKKSFISKRGGPTKPRR